MTQKTPPNEAGRRGFMLAAAGLAVTPLAGAAIGRRGPATGSSKGSSGAGALPFVEGRRRLGTLEVSSIGIGAQNMSRTYPTTIPNRAEMHQILRAAFERGVTFFDAAEAYGPHEVERILGKGWRRFATRWRSPRSLAGTSICRPASVCPA